MLALTTTTGLTLIDASTIKRIPSKISTCHDFSEPPTALTWSQDNSTLLIASAQSIYQYNPSGTLIKKIYTSSSTSPIENLLSKDSSSLLFSTGENIHTLESISTTPKLTSLSTQKSPLNSLSLSNDTTLLACTTSSSVHIHNLSLSSQSTLRGLPLNQPITASAFHPHTRTRLLLAVGRMLVVYDITKPSGPLKAVTLDASMGSDIVAVGCSPFSKTLCAVATSSGFVGLIDLEKDKSPFRIIPLKTPLTSLSFSPEGASIFAGTENGKLFVIDLRALDAPPKVICVGENGGRVAGICVQQKVKTGTDATKVSAGKPVETTRRTTTSTIAATTKGSSKSTITLNSRTSPSKPTTRSSTRLSAAAIATTRTSGGGGIGGKKEGTTPAKDTGVAIEKVKMKEKEKTVGMRTKDLANGKDEKVKVKPKDEKAPFSPVRDPLGNSTAGGDGNISLSIEKLIGGRGELDKEDEESEETPKGERVVGSKGSRLDLVPKDSKVEVDLRGSRFRATLDVPRAGARTRTNSSASRAGLELSAGSAGVVTSTGESISSTTDRISSSRPRARLISSTSSGLLSKTSERTPSPDLPALDKDPISPMKATDMGKGKRVLGVLGLGTPELERWVTAGEGDKRGEQEDAYGKGKSSKKKGKKVGFLDSGDDVSPEAEAEGVETGTDAENMAIQISPRRLPAAATSTSWTTVPSPLRHTSTSPSTSGSTPHDLLRTIVADVMYDLHREQKAQMMGLHLDMVRMGRGWRKEMGDIVREMGELKNENGRLRAENERLRRGY